MDVEQTYREGCFVSHRKELNTSERIRYDERWKLHISNLFTVTILITLLPHFLSSSINKAPKFLTPLSISNFYTAYALGYVFSFTDLLFTEETTMGVKPVETLKANFTPQLYDTTPSLQNNVGFPVSRTCLFPVQH